jgi:hypothetical protein
VFGVNITFGAVKEKEEEEDLGLDGMRRVNQSGHNSTERIAFREDRPSCQGGNDGVA